MKPSTQNGGWLTLAALLLMMPLIGCGGVTPLPTATVVDLAGPPPAISDYYAALLKQGPDELKREALKHEYDWIGWSKKARGRMGQ